MQECQKIAPDLVPKMPNRNEFLQRKAKFPRPGNVHLHPFVCTNAAQRPHVCDVEIDVPRLVDAVINESKVQVLAVLSPR